MIEWNNSNLWVKLSRFCYEKILIQAWPHDHMTYTYWTLVDAQEVSLHFWLLWPMVRRTVSVGRRGRGKYTLSVRASGICTYKWCTQEHSSLELAGLWPSTRHQSFPLGRLLQVHLLQARAVGTKGSGGGAVGAVGAVGMSILHQFLFLGDSGNWGMAMGNWKKLEKIWKKVANLMKS